MNSVSTQYRRPDNIKTRQLGAFLLALLFFTFYNSASYAQGCSVSSLTLNTGYDPLSDAAITPGSDGCTPVTDPKWIISAMSSTMPTAIANANSYSYLLACPGGVTAVGLGNAADIVDVTWYAPDVKSNFISCLNAHFIETAGTGAAYNFTASRTFTMCVGDNVSFNLHIICDNYATSVLIDGSPATYTAQQALPVVHDNWYTESMYLCAGTHTIEVVANNLDNSITMPNGMGLDISGTVSTSGGNTIMGETGGCTTCSTGISGPGIICTIGSTITLSSGSGGTWSSGTPAVATVDASGVVTGLFPGTTVITYTDGCGAVYYHMVTVAPSTPISGPSTVCKGASIVLSGGSAGGIWISSNPAVASVVAGPLLGNGTVTGITTGTATIEYVLACGIAYLTVTVLPTPTTSGTPELCITGTTTLSGTPPAGGVWSGGGTFASIANIGGGNGKVTGMGPGTEIFTYRASNGCTVNVTVTVDPVVPSISGPATVCVGLTATLTLPISSTGTWSSSTGHTTVNSSGIVTGVTAGTTTIIFTNTCGMATHVMTVLANAAITGATSFCLPGSTTLTATPGAGGAWSGGVPLSFTVLSPGVISVSGGSTGTGTFVFTSSSGCQRSVTVSANTMPGISGPAIVCQGGTINLSVTGGPGGTWSSSSTAIATVGLTTGIVTGVLGGAVTIFYTNACGTASQAITVNAAPSITGDPDVCLGNTGHLSCTPLGGTWSSSNPGILSITPSGDITGAGIAPGTSTVSYATGGGCVSTKTVSVNPMPFVYVFSSSSSIHCASGPGVTLSMANSDPWVKYYLLMDGATTGITVTGVSGGFTFTGFYWGTHNYEVECRDTTTGCYLFTPSVHVTMNPGCKTGGNVEPEAAITGFKVFPNPTNGTLNIQTQVGGVFNLYSLEGKELQQYAVSEGTTSVNLPGSLTAGIYLCRFTDNNGAASIVRLVYEP